MSKGQVRQGTEINLPVIRKKKRLFAAVQILCLSEHSKSEFGGRVLFALYMRCKDSMHTEMLSTKKCLVWVFSQTSPHVQFSLTTDCLVIFLLGSFGGRISSYTPTCLSCIYHWQTVNTLILECGLGTMFSVRPVMMSELIKASHFTASPKQFQPGYFYQTLICALPQ